MRSKLIFFRLAFDQKQQFLAFFAKAANFGILAQKFWERRIFLSEEDFG
jgi:hypothetical protein